MERENALFKLHIILLLYVHMRNGGRGVDMSVTISNVSASTIQNPSSQEFVSNNLTYTVFRGKMMLFLLYARERTAFFRRALHSSHCTPIIMQVFGAASFNTAVLRKLAPIDESGGSGIEV